jgi:hypothetical protein
MNEKEKKNIFFFASVTFSNQIAWGIFRNKIFANYLMRYDTTAT